MLDELLTPQKTAETGLIIACVPAKGRVAIRAFITKSVMEPCVGINRPFSDSDLVKLSAAIEAEIMHYSICGGLPLLVQNSGHKVPYPVRLNELGVYVVFPRKKGCKKFSSPKKLEKLFLTETKYTWSDQEIDFYIIAEEGTRTRASAERTSYQENHKRRLAWSAAIPTKDVENPSYSFAEEKCATIRGKKEEAYTVLSFKKKGRHYQGSARLVHLVGKQERVLLFDEQGKLSWATHNERPIGLHAIPKCFGLPEHRTKLDYDAMLKAFTRAAMQNPLEKLPEPDTVFPLLRYQEVR